MNPFKEEMREKARKSLTANGIEFKSNNNDLQWTIGTINYYPTTGKWLYFDASGIEGHGYKDLIKHLKPKPMSVKKLSVEQIFQIATHSKDKSLFGICESIYKEIYK